MKLSHFILHVSSTQLSIHIFCAYLGRPGYPMLNDAPSQGRQRSDLPRVQSGQGRHRRQHEKCYAARDPTFNPLEILEMFSSFQKIS